MRSTRSIEHQIWGTVPRSKAMQRPEGFPTAFSLFSLQGSVLVGKGLVASHVVLQPSVSVLTGPMEMWPQGAEVRIYYMIRQQACRRGRDKGCLVKALIQLEVLY